MDSKTKTVGVFLALSLATSLVACGGNNSGGNGDDDKNNVQPTEQPHNAPKQDDEGGEGGEGGEG